MSVRVRWLVMLAGLVAATAGAQTSDITVTGTRQTPAAIRQHATDFVRTTGIALGDLPTARWVDPVCPHLIGLADQYAAIVEAKVRAIATEAGIQAATAPCQTNVAVVFAADGGTLVRDLVGRAPRRFAGVRPAAIATLTDGSAPIRWWYTTEVRDKDGRGGNAEPPPAFGLNGTGSSLPVGEDTTFLQHSSTSLVSTETIRVLRSATVVIDIKRTEGLPLASVASYAAMVALAEMRPGAAGGVGSVLGLFDGGDPPRSPTAWDIAFLRAVYRLPLDRRAEQQRRVLIGDLVAGQ